MISEATVMSKRQACPPSLGPPGPPQYSSVPVVHVHDRATGHFGIDPNSLPWKMWFSNTAAKRLWAVPMAWMSPVKCRLMSSMGTTWLYPPPAAPPLIPKVGPKEGSRRQTATLLPNFPRAWVRPMAVQVFPSPAGVAVIAVV